MKIAIASGKGGTGKSTVSTNLVYLLSKFIDDVALLDCDVEEPNCHLFLKPDITNTEKVFITIPEIDAENCIKCGKCAEVCQFNALALIKDKVLKFPELCHGCGSCTIACPASAIKEGSREIGDLEEGFSNRIKFIHGKLRIGEAMSPPLIKSVKKQFQNIGKIQIIDCPPGTSCPAIAAISDCDFAILVTEPTPFGLYDLRLAVEVIKKINMPFGIVINRSSENDSLIIDYANEENIKILAQIPDKREIAEQYSKGAIIIEELPEYKTYFLPIIDFIREKI